MARCRGRLRAVTPAEPARARQPGRLPYLPALDGIRGLAAAGILLFHAGHLVGGWLAIDLFFTLSGFLITSLLLAEFADRGRIALVAFWGQRARRLLPALIMVLFGVCAYTALLAEPEQYAGIRADALATLFYAANWNEILTGRDYWELFTAPSPLDHTWSLAIEEQFYILWPPLVVLALVRARLSVAALGVLAGLLSLASALWMAALFDPTWGTARVYYGTDTRIQALAMGAALAVGLGQRVQHFPAALPRLAIRRAADVVGLLAMLLLGAAWVGADGQDPRLYRGGLFALGLLAISVTGACVVSPRGVAARVLGLAPLRRLGLWSYGIYLWHWPVYIVLDEGRTGLAGWDLTALRTGVAIAVAGVSYTWIEGPIRRREWPSQRLVRVGALAGVGLLAAIFAATPRPTVLDPAGPRASFADGAIDLLVIGDSTALHLRDALLQRASERALRVEVLGALGCGILPSQQRRFADGSVFDSAHCPALSERWHETVATTHPGLVLIFENLSGAAAQRVDGQWRTPCEPQYREAYAAALSDTARRFSRHATRAVLLRSLPASAADLRAPFRRQFPDQTDAEVNAFFEERTACLNAAREQAAAATHAPLLDLRDLACPNGPCLRELEGNLLRPDGVHFKDAGADQVARWLLDQLTPLLEARNTP